MNPHRGRMLRERAPAPSLPATLVLVGAFAWPTAPSAAERPADPVQVLRVRPTGMDETVWKRERREIAKALGQRRDRDAVDALLEVVAHERYDALLSIAIESLGTMGDPRAIPALTRVAEDRSLDAFVREAARTSIRALGGNVPGTPTTPETPMGPSTGPLRLLDGPQLGAMGEASAAPETEAPIPKLSRRSGLLGRDRSFALILGSLDLRANTWLTRAPVLLRGGLGADARYAEERVKYGFVVEGRLDAAAQNGDATVDNGAGSDDGDLFYLAQALRGRAGAHYYLGRSTFHVFGQAGLSQRLLYVRTEDLSASQGVDESNLSGARFGLDVSPAAGLGFGRLLNRGTVLRVDALFEALRRENILLREPDDAVRDELAAALFGLAQEVSSFPSLAAALAILERAGLLARAPSARLVHRLRSLIEDPSFLDRREGWVVRVGFLYDYPLGQADIVNRGRNAIGAPFVQLEGGRAFGPERHLLVDARGFYDVLGIRGFTSEAGATFTQAFHTRYGDYRGQAFAGLRGGASLRAFPVPDGTPAPHLGYRAVASGGYAFGFRKGSEISLAAHVGTESGGLVAGAALGFRLGLVRSSFAVRRTPSATGPARGAASAVPSPAVSSPTTPSPAAPSRRPTAPAARTP